MKHIARLIIVVGFSQMINICSATDDVIFRCFFTKDTVSVKFSPSGAYYVLSGDKIHHGVMVFNSDGTVYKRLVMPADDGDYARLEQRGFFNDSLLITYDPFGSTILHSLVTGDVFARITGRISEVLDDSTILVYEWSTGQTATYFEHNIYTGKRTKFIDGLTIDRYCASKRNENILLRQTGSGGLSVVRRSDASVIAEIPIHERTNVFRAYAFDPTGDFVFVLRRMGYVDRVRLEDGVLVSTFAVPNTFYQDMGMSVSPDGQTVGVTIDTMLYLYDRSGTLLHTIQGASMNPFMTLSWSPDSKRMFSGRMYDVVELETTGRIHRTLSVAHNLVFDPAICVSTCGYTKGISTTSDITQEIDYTTGAVTLNESIKPKYRLANSDSLVRGELGSIGIYDFCESQTAKVYGVNMYGQKAFASTEMSYLAGPGDATNKAYLYYPSENLTKELYLPDSGAVCYVTPFRHDSMLLIVGLYSSSVYDVTTGIYRTISGIGPHRNIAGPYLSCISEDGNVAVMFSDGLYELTVYKPFPKPLFVISLTERTFLSRFDHFALSKDGRFLFTAQLDGRLRLFETSSMRIIAETTLVGHKNVSWNDEAFFYDFENGIVEDMNLFREFTVFRWPNMPVSVWQSQPARQASFEDRLATGESLQWIIDDPQADMDVRAYDVAGQERVVPYSVMFRNNEVVVDVAISSLPSGVYQLRARGTGVHVMTILVP